MDILAGLRDKLRFIERFYGAAAEPFADRKRKIEAEEPPFVPPPFDPDSDTGEPPFQVDWEEADDCLNLVGQAALSLVQSALREHLDGFIRLSRQAPPTGRGNWFERYKTFYLDVYGIDWEKSTVSPLALEEINLARNDIQHSGQEFGMEKLMSKKHHRRFPDGMFAHQIDKEMGGSRSDSQPRIYVSEENLSEAIRRVETFCEFIEKHRFF